ncbi:putative phosphatidylinositol 4-kinase [Trypanosoma theileri]|uniref:non-specific serine/threonine protein kinase n=1 Tax=Trypanosoma theileri TaxID=67003 RepID=A0A1X0PAZ7_9TRYP|nr:putative phosphatidylinositol 4-kinase [Trypanosoma theileri]ORC93803.1 putative phosphatidylinositol 4-kinase [Trypanosoma theileri]
MTDVVDAASSRFFSESTSPLGRQFSIIFLNLQTAPDNRRRRVDECLSALLDLLVAHIKEVSEHTFMDYLFQLVGDTFGVSIERGILALRVVFDVHVGDQHEERSRCLQLLMRQALSAKSEEACTAILHEFGEVLQENVRSTSDLLGKHLNSAISELRSERSVQRKAIGWQILATIVETSSGVVKRHPPLLDSLNSSCKPFLLLKEIIESSSMWHRHALSSLLKNIMENHCIELVASEATKMSDILSDYMKIVSEEEPIIGVLTAVKTIASSPILQGGVPWSLKTISSFFIERDWKNYSKNVRVMVAQSTGKILCLFTKNEQFYDKIMQCFLSYISDAEEEVALSALTTFYDISGYMKIIPYVESAVNTIRVFIITFPFHPIAFDTLERLRAGSGDIYFSPIYDLLDISANDMRWADLQKVNALLRFLGDRRPHIRERFAALPLDLSPGQTVEVIRRALPLVATLRRTAQLHEAVELMFHENVGVRREAVAAVVALCEALLRRGDGPHEGRAPTHRINADVAAATGRLLDVAVADPDADIRYDVLCSLEPVFDAYLALPDNLDALFMARKDVCRQARDRTLVLLCRLMPCHPAFVHPHLLQLQEYMLREIEAKDGSMFTATYLASLLQMVIEHNALLLQPMTVETIVLARLETHSFACKSFSIALLNLLKAVLDHTGPQNHCDARQILQPVISIVNVSTSSKRRKAALETLCSVLTTISISDQATYLDVYRALTRIIRSEAEEDESVNYEAVRALSVIGAVNPIRIRGLLETLQEDEIEEEEEVVTPGLAHYKPRMRAHPQMDDRYPSIVLYFLVKTLQQSADSEQQADTIATINSMIREASGKQKAVLLTQFLPQLQTWLVEPEKAHLYEGILLLMTELASLLRQYKEIIGPNTGSELLKSVRLFCALPQASQAPLNAGVVELLDEVARGLSAQEMRDHRWAVEFIHQCLSQDKQDLALVLRAVKSLDSFLEVLHEKDLQVVLPHVLQCIDPVDSISSTSGAKTKEINTACLDFLNQIMLKQSSLVKDCCAEIVHTILWYIGNAQSRDEMEMGFNTLAFLVEVVKHPARRFIRPIQLLAKKKGYPETFFKELIQSAAQGFLKVRVPASKHDKLNPQLPLSVISHLPGLSRKDFEDEMMNALHLGRNDFEVMGVSHPTGQTIIHFRFFQSEDSALNFHSFTRKAQEIQSTLRRNLGILKLDQTQTTECKVDEDLLRKISTIPSANKKKREQSWIAWLHNTSVAMLKNSPIQPLRSTTVLADNNIDLSRDLFSFAAAAFITQLDKAQRTLVMNTFTRAAEMSPNDIKQVLFAFEEFLESERGKEETKLVKRIESRVCVVEREDVQRKFGINYDQSGGDIVVTKLEPNGPGARAGVPVGAILISINGKKITAVNEIVATIKGLNKIELLLSYEVEERQKLESKPLMDIDVLARVAFDSQMHAKAIFLNEVLFDQLFSELGDQVSGRQDAAVRRALEVAERLIGFYGHLGLTMVAEGLVKKISAKFSGNIIAPEQFGFDEVGTLEQLNWWGDALIRYQSRMTNTDGSLDVSSFLGTLRCYDALGETVTMEEHINVNWDKLDHNSRLEVAPLKAKAALSLGKWRQFDELIEQPAVVERLEMVEHCAALFRQQRYQELLKFVEERRESLFDPFSESLMESYNRSYDTLVQLQHLRHFEELVSFVTSDNERRNMLRELWQRRLMHMSSRPAHVKTLVTINSLVLSPEEDLTSQIVCIRTLSKSQWTSLGNHMLNLLLGPNRGSETLCHRDPDVIHAYMKHCYATDNKHETFTLLSDILTGVKVSPGDDRAEAWGSCWLLLGEWTMHLFPERGNEAIEKLKRATELSPKSYAAFHSLGILHHDLSRDPNTPLEVQTEHHVNSISALFNSVKLSKSQTNGVMEDVLRILSIWFSYSTVKEVNDVIKEGISKVPVCVWLNVIPQLVARIGITAKLARTILTELLVLVGSEYPHALIYPLTVTEKSPEAIRRLMAERVLKGIRVSNDTMVKEASLISNEMVRIAILWSEKWISSIHRAASTVNDADAILRVLNPLYEELENPSTPNETSFAKTYGQVLQRAKVALNNKNLDHAWGFLKQVYVQLNKTTGERRLLMEDVSPTLGGISKSNVAVPGTFVLGQQLITIQKFHQRVIVMPSKQKPRRFGLDASDGGKYRFLLKGHEDLRQDERVMQFIELINTIFSSDSSASAIGLAISRYAVIPLTDNVGIIGWVENTETIYKMLETRRKEYGISIYEEVNLIVKLGGLQNIADYHSQAKQQRKHLLSQAMNKTPDDELQSIIWDKNDTCEQWLQYRGTYGHTLAIMSIVGYVLGLGDRHLNNLMLQDKGSVVHIDFGDCFEVAMHRAQFAEAVPFRLTRLLVRALGISGVDGVYRLTCELVMKNLRRHCENLLSILEAFIYDPLINWRLANVGEGDRSSSRVESQAKTGDNHVLAPAEKTAEDPQMQLSYSVMKVREPVAAVTVDQMNEEETRNMQGDLALARVRAKLTGEEFGVTNGSFLLQGSKRETGDDSGEASLWGLQSYGNSPKDSFGNGGTVLTTYLSLRYVKGGDNCLDVPHQVDRLIKEATSLDNLAEAYITGWAPFW